MQKRTGEVGIKSKRRLRTAVGVLGASRNPFFILDTGIFSSKQRPEFSSLIKKNKKSIAHTYQQFVKHNLMPDQK